jgi:hypothetical protein
LALRGRVIVPRELGHHPRLWWMNEERQPHIGVVTLSVLERETDTEIGLSPFCVEIGRWNEAARNEPWLPFVPTDSEPLQHPYVGILPTSRQLDSLTLPNPPSRWIDLEFDGDHRARIAGDRLRAGSHAVSQLFADVRWLIGAGALVVAIAACAYYLAGAGQWLWTLEGGMTGARAQEGVVLIVVALLFSRLTGTLRQRWATPHDAWALPHRRDRRERQLALDAVLDAYRLGIAVQVVAFGAFVIF